MNLHLIRRPISFVRLPREACLIRSNGKVEKKHSDICEEQTEITSVEEGDDVEHVTEIRDVVNRSFVVPFNRVVQCTIDHTGHASHAQCSLSDFIRAHLLHGSRE